MAAKSKKKSSRKPTKKKKTEQSFLQDEVIIWLTLAVSLLLILSNFGLGGWIGDEVSYFFSGIFGLITYIIPFALFGIAAFLVSNKGNVSAYIKVAAGIVFLILACTFLELVDHKGGSLGKSIAKILTPTIGTAGTYVVIIIFMIICCVIITGKSLLQGVKTQSGKAYDKAKGDNARRRKEAELRRKEIAPEPVKEPVPEPEESPSFVINRTEPEPDIEEAEPFAEEPYEPVRESKKKSGAMAAAEMERVAAAVAADEAKPKKAYHFPPMNLLKRGNKTSGESDAHLRETAMKLQQILQNFGVSVTVTNVSCGPAVTRYELQPEMGVKVSKIVGLTDDIKLNLAAADIRIEAPIPGKAAVGIEVPNKENSAVMLRDLLETAEFKNSQSKISFAAGKDIAGKVVVADIAKMPHLLIAGATGSGKSVCINTIIMSIIYKADPEEVKMIMIDPKMVELRVYDGIPHLMIPVVIDPKKASGALNWAVNEMTDRYKKFAQMGVRNLKGYNDEIAKMEVPEGEEPPQKMPQLVIIIDELADLMMVAPGEVEDAICRLAQLARAAGIHLVIATQRPSVNVITGLIKANVPSRIAFAVSSGVDSRTIIDMNGAEKLLGKGDMLFFPSGYPKPVRVQGAFVSDDEVSRVVDFLKENSQEVVYDEAVSESITSTQSQNAHNTASEKDSYFAEAGRFIIEKEKGSIGMLQRYYKIGFNRAARIMDQLADAGVVGPEVGTKPRKVLMTPEEFETYLKQNT